MHDTDTPSPVSQLLLLLMYSIQLFIDSVRSIMSWHVMYASAVVVQKEMPMVFSLLGQYKVHCPSVVV